MTPCLDGTGRVGDDLWLLAHNDVTGRPCLQPRPLGLGLAGALLGELVLTGLVSVAGDDLTLEQARRRPGEQVLTGVLGALEREPEEHPVGEWLDRKSVV